MFSTIQSSVRTLIKKVIITTFEELDNNFKEYWLGNSSNIKKPPFYGYCEWSLCALRNYASMIELISELKSNSINFDKENGDWCLHLSDWWFFMILSGNTRSFNGRDESVIQQK